jgi:hypothetical protein
MQTGQRAPTRAGSSFTRKDFWIQAFLAAIQREDVESALITAESALAAVVDRWSKEENQKVFMPESEMYL